VFLCVSGSFRHSVSAFLREALPGTVALTVIPEDHNSRPARVKSSQNPISTNKKRAWWHIPVVLSYVGTINRINIQAGQGGKARPYSKKYL
jgi:hypothetical protein